MEVFGCIFPVLAGSEPSALKSIVVVKPDEVDDPSMQKLAFDMAKKIEADLDYPGEVRVSVIRETRAASVAR